MLAPSCGQRLRLRIELRDLCSQLLIRLGCRRSHAHIDRTRIAHERAALQCRGPQLIIAGRKSKVMLLSCFVRRLRQAGRVIERVQHVRHAHALHRCCRRDVHAREKRPSLHHRIQPVLRRQFELMRARAVMSGII
jgi:hypothetical protein